MWEMNGIRIIRKGSLNNGNSSQPLLNPSLGSLVRRLVSTGGGVRNGEVDGLGMDR